MPYLNILSYSAASRERSIERLVRRKLRLSEHREQKNRYEWIDTCNAIDKKRKVTFHKGASLITVSKRPGYQAFEGAQHGQRGIVKGYSHKSRRRFLLAAASMREDELPLFIRLSYPADWPQCEQTWKEHLNVFLIYVRRKWGKASGLWKLEPQERGAPHFHLIIYGVEFMPKEWLAETWNRIVGGGHDHLMYGTRVERARSVRGVMCYASKKYMGKEIDGIPAGWKNPGRFWGMFGRHDLPRGERVECYISKRGHARMHRIMRKLMKSRGIEWNSGGELALFTQRHLEWLRVVEWAETDDCQGIDRINGVPLERQPF